MSRQLSKVVFIVPYSFIPPRNGGHNAAYGFSNFLGRDTPLLVISSKDNEDTNDFKLAKAFSNRFYRYFSFWVAKRISGLILREKVKKVIFHQPFLVPLLYPFLKRHSIEFGVFVQNIEFQRFKSLGKWWWPLMYLFEKWVYKRANHLFYIAHSDFELGNAWFQKPLFQTSVVPYGTSLKEIPSDRSVARSKIDQLYNLPGNAKLVLFFGPQSYKPNLEAVRLLKDKIAPYLGEEAGIHWVICGGGMPEHEKQWFEQQANWHYLGFVEDIESVIKGADVMVNPILSGGGVKTKIIESIAYGTSVVSFYSGAIGVDESVTQHKLFIVPDDDEERFANTILDVLSKPYQVTAPSFYETYYWQQSLEPVVNWINA